MKSKGYKLGLFAAFFVVLFLIFKVSGCGFEVEPSKKASSTGLQALAWAPTSINPVDGGNGLVMVPEIAIEPDPAGDDGVTSSMAVWLEQVDENPLDLLPPVTHLYARYSTGGSWETNDASCPGDGRLENIDADGVCQVDTVTDSYNATAPRIAMNGDGDAILVWQQSDGTDCFSAVSGTQPCTRIYARAFTGGVWSSTVTLVSIGGADRPAANPDIAMEPDSDGTAIAVFDQWDGSIWRIRANRCADGGDAGTACGDDAAEWGATGTAYIDGGTYISGSPRIGMDAAGNATVGWIRFIDATCINPVTSATFTCRTSKVYVNRSNTDGSAWGVNLPDWAGATNISPGIISSCGDGSSVCINFGQLRIARGSTTSFVIFKAFEFGGPAPDGAGNCPSSWCGFGENDMDQFADIRMASIIYSYRVTNTAASMGRLNYYRVFDGTSNGDIFCASLNNASSQFSEKTLNCDLDAPDIAVEPDSGATAVAVYEQYDGTTSFIRSRRYSGGWGAAAVISTGSNDAYAPRVSSDNNGNTVAVWVQSDGTKWRIYSRQNIGGVWVTTDAAGGCTAGGLNGADDGVCNVDGDIGPETAYYNPVVAMDQLGSANSLFIGWTSIGSNTSTRLLAVTGP